MPPSNSKIGALILPLIAAALPVQAAAAAAAAYRVELAGPPAGFEELDRFHELLVDVYFGGSRIGETRILAKPGSVKLTDPGQVLGLVPNIRTAAALAQRLAAELPANSALACGESASSGCSKLSPEIAGVIFDEDRLRIDLFVNPAYLAAERALKNVYLAPPTAPVSLTSSAGLSLSGSGSASPTYNFQNRTIFGFRNGRVRSDSSVASGLGVVVDDLVTEIDTDRHRYSGGLFWAPGLDLTGRRRIVGLGFGTQFDTRADRESLSGTPLVVFLAQPARVEVLIDGRLIASGSYQAGNNLIDTSGLPSGAYPLVLRIREPGGAAREERRFFVKNAQVAPIGEPVYFAYAGLLANTRRNRPISLSKSLFYQAGAARRLSQNVALDASVIGTEKKILAEAGAWLLTRYGRLRAAGLVSSAGDRGILVQLGSAGGGRLNFNLDLRRIWSSDGKPLIPLPSYVDNFGSVPATGAQVGNGSYTQASGSIAYSIGAGFLSLTGSYRRDRSLQSDYSIGPSLSWPLVNRNGIRLILQADAQRTRTSVATFLGVRALFTSGRLSMLSSGGRGSIHSRDGSRASVAKGVTSLSGQWSYQNEDRTEASLRAGFDRNLDSTSANLEGNVNSRFGSLRADILRNFDKGPQGLQYGLSFQSGVAATGGAVELGGRDLNESALITSIGGSARDTLFDVLVDGLPRGRIRAGGRLPIFLQAYRSYQLRLKPVGPASVDFDSGARMVTLFPGNVAHVRWTADHLTTLFGRAMHADGKPVANAMVQSRRGVGQTDADGYFQIDSGEREQLVLTSAGGASCRIQLNQLESRGDYASIGKVICR